MASVDVELQGDWKTVVQHFHKLETFARVLTERVAQGIAQQYFDSLVGHIKKQDLPLAPLNEWYRAWKEKRGLDTRILIATGELLSNIQIYKGPNKGERFIGVKGGKQHKGGIDMALLALIHEYGTEHPRAAYRLTLQELKAQLQFTLDRITAEVRVEVFGK